MQPHDRSAREADDVDDIAVELDLTDSVMAALAAKTEIDIPVENGPAAQRRAPHRRLVFALVVTVLAASVLVGAVGWLARRPVTGTLLAGPVRLSPPAAPTGVGAFSGLGAWVDIYDYAPVYQRSGSLPLMTPERVAEMRAAGVRTLFLQTAGSDRRESGDLVDPALAEAFLSAAHQHGVRVVGWFAPTLTDPDRDFARLQAVATFDSHGQHFDGIAVDIEPGGDDPAIRSTRLVDLSRRLSQAVAHRMAMAAITPAPVLLEDVNPKLWPGFPWRELAGLYDVWMPMNYWTLRGGPDRDPSHFTRENLSRLRQHLGDPQAPVHALGGVGQAVTESDVSGFVEAAAAESAIGASIYDYRTLSLGALGRLSSGTPPTGFTGGPSPSPSQTPQLHE